MNLKAIENHLTQLPIYQYAFFTVNELVFNDKARNICKKECLDYGRSWACPPVIGSLKQCKHKCMEYDQVLLFSTITKVSEFSQKENVECSKKEHEELTEHVEEFLKNENLEFYTLSTEVCSRCEKCSYPKKACVNPERMHPCMEGHGIFLSKIVENQAMDYFMDAGMILRFSLVFLKER